VPAALVVIIRLAVVTHVRAVAVAAAITTIEVGRLEESLLSGFPGWK
jgi:hypothetical protein